MTTADELAKLHDLLSKGALTQEEFNSAKARLLGALSPELPSATAAINSFRRSQSDKWIAGVCGGLAVSTDLDAWVWRLLFVLGLLVGGFTLIVYLLLWIFVPRDLLAV